MNRARVCRFLICLVACIAAGCAGYQVGPTNGRMAGDRTVEISPFSNQTFEPRLGDALTAALRRDIQRDGTYRLSTHGKADVVVTGTITDFIRRQLSLAPQDALTVLDYQLVAVAQVKAVEVGSGNVLFDQRIRGSTLVRVGSDLASAERQATPLLADDLAKRICDLIVDGTW
jgi:hypothetical protein